MIILSIVSIYSKIKFGLNNRLIYLTVNEVNWVNYFDYYLNDLIC